MMLPLLSHPVVIAAAEEMARDILHGYAVEVGALERTVAGCARLLCRLDRPASRDWWVRWLAARYGIDTEGGARWQHFEREHIHGWELVGDECVREWSNVRAEGACCCDITDPTEALAAAVLAALENA